MTVVALVPTQGPPHSGPRRKMSREAAVAIGVSAAFHIGVIGYIATQTFNDIRLTHDDPPPIGVETVRLPQDPPEKAPPPKPVSIHRPPSDNLPPPVDPLPAVATPPVVATADPPVTLPVVATPPQPPVQLADARPVEPPRARVINNPTWLRRPSGEELGRLYPRLALERNISGGATLMCEVAANGAVRACAVIDEAPKGRGFGEAALAGAKLFRLNPRTVDGQAVEGAKVRIPLVFNLAD